MSTKEVPAAPRYARGDTISYLDHHMRRQTGKVLRIEASWAGYLQPGEVALIVYTVEHPTYANRRMYIGEERLLQQREEDGK